jgi:hypothetical protein
MEIQNRWDILDTDFANLVDMATIAGYPRMEDREFKDDPQLWLSSDSPSSYSQEWWKDQFIQTFYEFSTVKTTSVLSLAEFVKARWMWSTGGATKYSLLTKDGEQVRTKFGAAVSLSDSQLLDMVFRPYETAGYNPDIGVFIKPDEKGYKRRLIANVPLGQYILAAYIRYVLEMFLPHNSPLMKSDLGLPEVSTIITHLNQDNTYSLPLDESAYDYHVTRSSWLGFIEFLLQVFPGNDGMMRFSEYFHRAKWYFGKESGSWKAGMPSGLALTSFLNSWMNYIKQKTIVPGVVNWASGDDALAILKYDPDLVTIENAYGKFGAEVNSVKNWKAKTKCEYLKNLFHRGGTLGYPARIYASLIWAGVDRAFLPQAKMYELTELWKTFYDRLNQPMDEDVVARDLARAVSQKLTGFSKATALKWLHSPKVRGGFGRLPYNDLIFDFETPILREDKYENMIIRIPNTYYRSRQTVMKVKQEPIRNVGFRIGLPPKLPDIVTLKDWETRINLEDIPLNDKWKSWFYETVSLPSIDLISTSQLSRYARSHGFWAYPNFYGSSKNYSLRLISAGLAVAIKLTDQLKSERISTFL